MSVTRPPGEAVLSEDDRKTVDRLASVPARRRPEASGRFGIELAHLTGPGRQIVEDRLLRRLGRSFDAFEIRRVIGEVPSDEVPDVIWWSRYQRQYARVERLRDGRSRVILIGILG